MTDINPYQILGVPTDATLETVKDVYRQLATKHHPDKGGNPETFKIVKLAFKMIVDNIKKGVQIPKNTANTFTDLKDAAQTIPPVKQQTPQEFFGQECDPNHEFNVQSFNQKFMQSARDDECSTGKNAEDYREKRTKEQLLMEQQSINDELSTIAPIFRGNEFDNNVFQRLFEQINGTPDNKTKELQSYEEPVALTSGLQPYTEIDDNQKCKETNKLSSLSFSDISEGFGQKNPKQFDRDVLSQMAKHPNITDVNVIESDYHNKMKQRLSDYQNAQMNFHPKPANPSQLPDQIRATNASIDKISQENLNDAYNRKMQERNSLYATAMRQISQPSFQQPQQSPQQPQQHRALPVMEYPQSSNMEKFNTPMQQPPQIQQPDYFAKIPSAQMHNYIQQNGFFQPVQQPMMHTGQMSLMNPINQTNMGPSLQQVTRSLPDFQRQTQPTQASLKLTQQPSNIEQIQCQLQALQKTVQKQKKIIRTLTKK